MAVMTPYFSQNERSKRNKPENELVCPPPTSKPAGINRWKALKTVKTSNTNLASCCQVTTASARCKGQCVQIPCELETISQEVTLLQKVDVKLEVCIGRLNYLLGDSVDGWDGQEVSGCYANGGGKSTQ
jgi:hypothetical protein